MNLEQLPLTPNESEKEADQDSSRAEIQKPSIDGKNFSKFFMENRKPVTTAHEQQREFVFDAIVFQNLINTFDDTLYDVGFDDKAVDEITNILSSLGDPDDLKRFFAIPFELRAKRFSQYLEKIEHGEITLSEMVQDIIAISKKHHLTLGYHVTNKQILKHEIKNSDGTVEWRVKGYELDDRDNMPMAYYSLDYMNMYRKKRPRYIYTVLANVDPSPNNSHKRDTSQNWGRAASLSIISEMDASDIETKIETITKDLYEHEKTPTN